MKLFAWKNTDGLHRSRPPKPSTLVEIDFDPDGLCRQCGERVLSLSADNSDICPWCESSISRPKMLRYQELELVRLLQKQSDENRELRPPKKRALIRNGGTEQELRDYLTVNGYIGRSADVLQLELKAIERPGWVQVFEFAVHAKKQDSEGNGVWKLLRGVIRADERSKQFDVEYFDATTRDATLRVTTDGMITTNRKLPHWTYWPLMTTFALMLGAAIVGGVLSTEAPPNTGKETAEAEE